jgi:hypothetical protein
MVGQDDVLRWLGKDGAWVSIEEMTEKVKAEDPRIREPRVTVTDVAAKLYRRWNKTLGIEKRRDAVDEPGRYVRVYYRKVPE